MEGGPLAPGPGGAWASVSASPSEAPPLRRSYHHARTATRGMPAARSPATERGVPSGSPKSSYNSATARSVVSAPAR